MASALLKWTAGSALLDWAVLNREACEPRLMTIQSTKSPNWLFAALLVGRFSKVQTRPLLSAPNCQLY